MKNFKSLLVHIFFVFVFSAVPIATVAQSKQYGKGADIYKFCAENENEPQPGMQFDGKEASVIVMQLESGRYEYPNEGSLDLFPEKYFVLKLPSLQREEIYGTDGNDLIIGGTNPIIGGCSLEQLSEVIRKNNMSIDSFKLEKPYTGMPLSYP